jgi:hypothetical protein
MKDKWKIKELVTSSGRFRWGGLGDRIDGRTIVIHYHISLLSFPLLYDRFPRRLTPGLRRLVHLRSMKSTDVIDGESESAREEREIKRHRERERERDKETERETDRQRETERQTERETEIK